MTSHSCICHSSSSRVGAILLLLQKGIAGTSCLLVRCKIIVSLRFLMRSSDSSKNCRFPFRFFSSLQMFPNTILSRIFDKDGKVCDIEEKVICIAYSEIYIFVIIARYDC